MSAAGGTNAFPSPHATSSPDRTLSPQRRPPLVTASSLLAFLGGVLAVIAAAVVVPNLHPGLTSSPLPSLVDRFPWLGTLSSDSRSSSSSRRSDLEKESLIVPDTRFEFAEGVGGGIGAGDVHVDVDKLQRRIDELALLSEDPPPAVTRVLFTEWDVKARGLVKAWMVEARLAVREDAIGNIFGRWEASDPSLPSVLTGSHTDAIPLAGKFDGVVGVLGAIAAVEALKSAGFSPHRPLEVVMFSSEEPTRFGIGCLGSRMLANQTGYLDKLLSLKDKEGVAFAEAAAQAGYPQARDRASVYGVALEPGRVGSFVELHIEQGPRLEEEGIDIGIVTAIAAPASLLVEFSGSGGHAGALLMNKRNDAGLAAAELSLAVESAVLATESEDTVGTTGHLVLHPNAVNSVPRIAHMEIDIRDISAHRRDAVVSSVLAAAERIARRRGVAVERLEVVNADPPAKCSPMVTSAVLSAVQELGLSHRAMVSRAYHDALFMARVTPTGMVFVTSRKGVSHRPDEFTSIDNLRNGVQVLALTLAKLSLV